MARDALSRGVTGQGLSGCPGAHERSGIGRTGTGVSSPQAQDSFQKQIWLKATQSGRLFQKALEASGGPRFCEASSADGQPGFCSPGSRPAVQGLGVGAAGGGLGSRGGDTTRRRFSAQQGGPYNKQRCPGRGVPWRGVSSPSLETLKQAPSALWRALEQGPC